MRIRVTGKHPVKGVKPRCEGDVVLSLSQARRLVARGQIEILDPPESPPDKPAKSSKRPRPSAGPSHATSESAAADQKSVEE